MKAIGSVSGNQPIVYRKPEAATQTFKRGVPVMLNASGNVIEWDGVTIGNGIAGISTEAANNLAVAGTPSVPGFSVPNQASAVSFYQGVGLNDGKMGIEVGAGGSLFFGEVASGSLATSAIAGVGYGMTKDSDGQWYVDLTKTGAQAVVTIQAQDDNDTRGVRFAFIDEVTQLLG